MRARLGALALAAVLISGLACDGGGGSLGPPKADLTGTWRATSSIYVSEAAPPQSVDLVTLGATVTLVLDANNTFTYTMTPAGGTPSVVTGTWQASADVFTLVASGSTGNWQWNYTLSATTLALTGANGEYDFNGDATAEPAKWNLVLAH